ncbi:hypothetical protein J0910_24070 [Nocardiopsis sp. CNT-189]|uniref:hypothetical protein n=1 Tax=Nocardiopsis oceanisediminis TaxID=2816862 RepID=UPI003B311EB0
MRNPPESSGPPVAVEAAGPVKTYGEGGAAVHRPRGADVGFGRGGRAEDEIGAPTADPVSAAMLKPEG